MADSPRMLTAALLREWTKSEKTGRCWLEQHLADMARVLPQGVADTVDGMCMLLAAGVNAEVLLAATHGALQRKARGAYKWHMKEMGRNLDYRRAELERTYQSGLARLHCARRIGKADVLSAVSIEAYDDLRRVLATVQAGHDSAVSSVVRAAQRQWVESFMPYWRRCHPTE